MTYSILARDPATGHFGGAAATGSLCVGGWVLRGDARAGMSASQGASPSTFWGEDVLVAMRDGADAAAAVSRITGEDGGRAARQLAALDRSGTGAVFTGTENTPEMGSVVRDNIVASGNLLRGISVLEAAADGFTAAGGDLPERLLVALRAGEAAGGDIRGLMSAAILLLGEDIPPFTLRVDFDESPVERLGTLLLQTRESAYASWLQTVPVIADPFRS